MKSRLVLTQENNFRDETSRLPIGVVLAIALLVTLGNDSTFAKKPPGHRGNGHGHHGNSNKGYHRVNVGPGGISYGYQSRNFGIVIGPSLGSYVDPYYAPRRVNYGSHGSYYERPDMVLPPIIPPQNEQMLGYHQQAENAFRQQQYSDAARLAKHALIEDSRNGKLHLFLSQALFAVGDYYGSADSIRQALPLLKRHQWGYIVESRQNYYANQQYATQLTRLTTFIDNNPRASDAFFVRGYQRLFLGQERAARLDLEVASQLDEQDPFAEELLRFTRAVPASNHEELPVPARGSDSRQSY